MIEERRKEELATLLRIVIQNTDIIPFRWHKSKYMCFYCRALFVESCSLKHHTTTEHKDIKLREIILRSLYRRGRTKLDVTNLNCKPCDTEMKNFTSFLKHLSIVHSLSFQTDAAQSFDCFALSDGGMCCLHCGQYFTFFGPLLLHTYKYHIDQFLCEVCGLGFVGKHNVHNHVKQIHNIKSCKDCGKTFQTQYALLNHTENVHKKEKLKCPICPEILGNRYLKKRHLALVHDCKKSQFVCELCSKIFTRNNKYIQHKLRVHFKEKNFTCEYCGHKAFNMDSLKCHMVCHNDARPFKCEVCEKTFRRKKTLVIHMRTHRTDDVVVVNINSF